MLLDRFTESILDRLTHEDLLLHALVSWYFDHIHQYFSQQHHTPDQVLSGALQPLSESHCFRFLEAPDKFDAMCEILYQIYNGLVGTRVTKVLFANALRQSLGYLRWLFHHYVECVLLHELSRNS